MQKLKRELDLNILPASASHMVQDEVIFYGHRNVQSLHCKTIEITKKEHLTQRGDCIIGVRSNKACFSLDETLKRRLKSNNSIVIIEIIVGNESFVVKGRGSDQLTLQNQHDIVIRKSGFVCPRTACVRCNGASSDVPRNMVTMLQEQDATGIFRITVE